MNSYMYIRHVLIPYSPAARGQKVEVEYVQTFIAVSYYVGVARCSCEAVCLNTLGKIF